MKCIRWFLLLLTVTTYGQTAEGEITTKMDWCLECHHQVIDLLKVIARGDSIIRHQASVIRVLQQDTIKHEHYVINNTFTQKPDLTKRQKGWRWVERVLFFGAVGTVIILKLEDDK